MDGKPGQLTSQPAARGLHVPLPVLLIVAFIVLGVVVALRLAVSRPTPAPSVREASESEPAKVEPLGQGDLHRVVLTAQAAQRLGIQTAPVREVEVARTQTGAGRRLVVPSAAVLYDVRGGTWVYTEPKPLVFVRHRIGVESMDGDRAVLSVGPPPGTKVVTVGAAELFGAEFGGLVEQ
jgi:hypothetical protein